MAAKKAIKPKFKNADELRAACENYFNNLPADTPPTKSGLTLHLHLSSERRFREQADRKNGEAFADVIDWCNTKIASWHETQVAKLPTNSMAWFRKNRPDEWGDQQDISVTGGGNVTVNINWIYE